MSVGKALLASQVQEIRETLLEVSVFARRLAEIDARLGSDARLAVAVGSVLPAGVHHADPKRLKQALTPIVVDVVRREMENSKDGIVQALYPLAGELIQAYLHDQFRRLLTGTDTSLRRWLSLKRAMLRIRSILTGVPYNKLKLLYHARVHIEQVLLVERGSGLLLDSWSNSALGQERGPRMNPALVAGLLAAINEFAREALDGASGLRTLDIGRAHVYLRATPKYILAVKVSGASASRLASHVDHVLGSTLAMLAQSSGPGAGCADSAGTTLERSVLADTSLLEGDPHRRPAFVYAALSAAAAAAMVLALSPSRGRSREIHDRAEQIVLSQPAVFASEVRVDTTGSKPVVHVSGVLPSIIAAQTLRDVLQSSLGDVVIADRFVFAVSEDVLSRVANPLQPVTTELTASSDRLPLPSYSIATELLKGGAVIDQLLRGDGGSIAQTDAFMRPLSAAMPYGTSFLPLDRVWAESELSNITSTNFTAPLFTSLPTSHWALEQTAGITSVVPAASTFAARDLAFPDFRAPVSTDITAPLRGGGLGGPLLRR